MDVGSDATDVPSPIAATTSLALSGSGVEHRDRRYFGIVKKLTNYARSDAPYADNPDASISQGRGRSAHASRLDVAGPRQIRVPGELRQPPCRLPEQAMRVEPISTYLSSRARGASRS